MNKTAPHILNASTNLFRILPGNIDLFEDHQVQPPFLFGRICCGSHFLSFYKLYFVILGNKIKKGENIQYFREHC